MLLPLDVAVVAMDARARELERHQGELTEIAKELALKYPELAAPVPPPAPLPIPPPPGRHEAPYSQEGGYVLQAREWLYLALEKKPELCPFVLQGTEWAFLWQSKKLGPDVDHKLQNAFAINRAWLERFMGDQTDKAIGIVLPTLFAELIERLNQVDVRTPEFACTEIKNVMGVAPQR